MPRRRTAVACSVVVATVLIATTACADGEPTARVTGQPSPQTAGTTSAPPSGADLAMRVPRAAHHATVLRDGRVLITGGCTEHGCEGFDAGQDTELYDPETRTFRAGPRMQVARASDTATLLPDGRVLLAGGYPAEGTQPTATAEIYDPKRRTFAPAGRMTIARAVHSATVLPDGRVLIAGGTDGVRSALATTELFEPRTNTFRPGPRLPTARSGHIAVRIGTRVAVIGGSGATGRSLRATHVLDGGAWRDGPALRVARVKHGAAPLPGGRILVIGGTRTDEGRNPLDSTEILDLRRGTGRPGPALAEGMYKVDGAVVTLSDGRVVIAAGTVTHIYDSSDGRMTVIDEPPVPRRSFVAAAPVAAQRVLITGGYDEGILPTADARLVTLR